MTLTFDLLAVYMRHIINSLNYGYSTFGNPFTCYNSFRAWTLGAWWP